MSFSALAPLWHAVRPPLRPSPEDLRIFRAALGEGRGGGPVLVLGATEELLELTERARGLDLSSEMVARVPGRASVGDWRSMPAGDQSVDAVLGDGSLSAVGDPAARRQVLAEVRRVLCAGGRLTVRTYTRPGPGAGAPPKKLDAAPPEGDVNALKIWLWGEVADGKGRVLLADVWRAFTALPEAVRGSLGPSEQQSVACYQHSRDSYWVPEVGEFVAEVEAAGFSLVTLHRPTSYALAERCPIGTFVVTTDAR